MIIANYQTHYSAVSGSFPMHRLGHFLYAEPTRCEKSVNGCELWSLKPASIKFGSKEWKAHPSWHSIQKDGERKIYHATIKSCWCCGSTLKNKKISSLMDNWRQRRLDVNRGQQRAHGVHEQNSCQLAGRFYGCVGRHASSLRQRHGTDQLGPCSARSPDYYHRTRGK